MKQLQAANEQSRGPGLGQDHREGPEDHAVRVEETAELTRTLSLLPPHYRKTLLLRELYRLDYAEIAVLLEKNERR